MIKRIKIHNVPKDCCCESGCNSKVTSFDEINCHGVDVVIALCEDHAKIYSKNQYTAFTKFVEDNEIKYGQWGDVIETASGFELQKC